jgi:hypothetical protein
MIHRTLALTLIGVLATGFDPGLRAQGQVRQLSIEALFIDPPKTNTPTRLWLKITNDSPRAQILCRSSWGYSWISDDPQEPSPGEAKASLHGCGDDDHDPLWLLLPGESRFDSYGLMEAGAPTAALEVYVDVMHHPVGAPGPGERVSLSWKGRVRDAMALGSKLATALLGR